MPPPAAAEFSVAQLTLLVLPVEVVVLLLLLELEEHAAVTSRLAATAAIAEIAGLARNIPSQTRSRGGTRCRSLARQVEMMASEYKHWVSVRFPAGIR
jgi:hypothetical protein